MIELEKLKRAQTYIEKLANGINPITDQAAADTDIINNVRLTRCFFYISDLIRHVIDNGGVIGKSGKIKLPFCISTEQLSCFEYSDTPIPISEITIRINKLINTETSKKLKATSITSWLVDTEILYFADTTNGKKVKRPTKSGINIGIDTENRTGRYGEYTVVVYNKAAQQFIIDNFDAIVEIENGRYSHTDKSAENQGQVWNQTDEEILIDLFKNDVPVSEIAITLKRTETGIRARLKRLGLIENRSDAK